MLCRLRRAAAGDEDGLVFPVRSDGLKQMIVGAAALSVLPEPPIVIEALDRPGIWISLVEVANLLGHSGGR
jgi:hypothetical protein